MSAIIILYLIMFRLGITCPIKYVTGISCAGCGMTRAWLSFLKGDIQTALSYHPLFPLPALFLPVWMLRKKMPKRVFMAITGVICLIFLIVYVKRLVDPEDAIVVCEIGEGVIVRFARMIYQLVGNA